MFNYNMHQKPAYSSCQHLHTSKASEKIIKCVVYYIIIIQQKRLLNVSAKCKVALHNKEKCRYRPIHFYVARENR